MKKRAIALFCLIFCVFFCGCGCDNYKIRKWTSELKQDELHFYAIFQEYYSFNEGNRVLCNAYDFATLSSDDMLYDSISFEYDVEEEILCVPFQIGKEIQYANEQIWISVIARSGIEMKNFKLTMKYLTVDEEQKSKEYLVDFTQQPLWDAREQTDSAC